MPPPPSGPPGGMPPPPNGAPGGADGVWGTPPSAQDTAGGGNGGKEPTTNLEWEDGKVRCVITTYKPGRSGPAGAVPMRGPKRTTKEAALQDQEKLLEAYRSGGDAEARRVQRLLGSSPSGGGGGAEPSANDGGGIWGDQGLNPGEQQDQRDDYQGSDNEDDRRYDDDDYGDGDRWDDEQLDDTEGGRRAFEGGGTESLFEPEEPQLQDVKGQTLRLWGAPSPLPPATNVWGDVASQFEWVPPQLWQALTGRLGFNEPTPLQGVGLPAILAGKDVVVEGPSHEGKSDLISIALAARMMAARPPPKPHTPGPDAQLLPAVLILTGTQESAGAIARRLWDLSKALNTNLETLVLADGESVQVQIGHIQRQPFDIVIAEPGRLMEVMDTGALSMQCVGMLFLDEVEFTLTRGEEVYQLMEAKDLPAPESRQVVVLGRGIPGDAVQPLRNWLRPPPDVVGIHVAPQGRGGGGGGGVIGMRPGEDRGGDGGEDDWKSW